MASPKLYIWLGIERLRKLRFTTLPQLELLLLVDSLVMLTMTLPLEPSSTLFKFGSVVGPELIQKS